MINPQRLARAAVVLCAVLAACDRGDPLAPNPRPAEPLNVARLSCSVTVATGAMECRALSPGTGAASGLIVGGPNGAYVQLSVDSHEYTPADSLYTIGVTVQNLIYQALGTTDGTTADADSVRIFFGEEPQGTAGALVPVPLVNERRGMFTEADQAYFQYAAPLVPNATSASVPWQFKVPAEVTRFAFVVYVSAAVQYPSGVVQVSPPADSVLAGGTVQLTGTSVDAEGDPVGGTPTWGTSDAGIATVDASGLVTAVAPGTATITATDGPRSGSATIAVCPNLALGGVYTADMPAGSGFCLGQGEYVVVPVNTAEGAGVSLGVTGAGIVPVSGPPSPALAPRAGPAFSLARRLVPDDAWETRLRERERREVAGRRPSAGRQRPGGPRFAITPGVPAVGALMSLNVETDDACSNFDTRTGRVMAVGTRVIVMADTMNPSGGLSAAQYQAIADSFDAVIHPAITGVFGAPADIDGNGRVIAFYTRAVNELTPPGSGAFVGGFFFSRDLLDPGDCPTSNDGEMFYMLAADPAGEVNGNVRSTSFIMDKTFGTLAHEFEHLINASRRMHVNTPWNGLLEETWLNEGLAHISEELVFYARTGLAPAANLDVADIGDGGAVQAAFFRYAESNYGRLRQWLLSPTASGPFQADDDLSTRGSAWAFLRYASDRDASTDAAFFGALLNTDETGVDNLQTVLVTDPLPWFRDFSAAMYADDAGLGAAAVYTQPSWNFRSIYAALDYDPGVPCSCAYELAVRNPANGVTDSFTLASGGASAYVRMGIPAGAFAGVTVLSGGSTPPATVRVVVIRRE